MASEIKVIKIVDSGCDRYKIEADCCCLGRQWDNYAEKIQVIVPESEKENACTMIVSADGEVIDHIQVTSEPKDITNVLSSHQFVEISFFFTNETEYLKNTEIKQFYFAKARKPEDFVAEQPEQTGKIDLLLNKGFVKAELDGDIMKFYNSDNEVVNEIEIKGIGGGITEETDPTVPQVVKNISEQDVDNWNNKVDTTTDNLVNYYLKQETYTRDEVNGLIATINALKKSIVDTLPTENIDENTIYLVAKTSGSGNDYYDEYLYINGSFEHIGSTQVNLDGFATTEQFESVNNKIDNIYNEDTNTLTAGNLSDGTTTKTMAEVLAGGSGGVSQEDFNSLNDRVEGIVNNTIVIDSGTNGFKVGNGASIDANSIAIGLNTSATSYGTAIGLNAKSTSGIAIGGDSDSANGVAIGKYAKISAGAGTAIGNSSKVYTSFGTAIGNRAEVSANDAVQLGEGNNTKGKTLQVLNRNIYDANTDTLTVANISDGTNTISVTELLNKLNSLNV